jgi:membrane-bound lytic murein transglycosylase D
MVLLVSGGEKLQARQSTLFPIPDILRPNVAFWVQIFTALDTQSGVLHDPTDVTIIYHTLRNLPEDPRQRRDQIERTSQQYTDILLQLAQGKRQHLSHDEARVLALFKGQATPEVLRTAADSIRFQLGLRNRFAEGMTRSGAFLPTIRRTFTAAGLPIELSYLPHVESSFNSIAYSKVGAAGMWQFIRDTGQRFLRIDAAIDERLDFRLATVAAAKLLHENYQELGTWPLAITAYNHGAYGMKRAVAEVGTQDFGTIVQRYKSKSFGFASKNFYAEFLAVLEIVNNRHKYFNDITFDPPLTYHTMTLDAFMSLQTLAQHLRVDAHDLARWNPALRPPVVQGKRLIPKGVAVYIPHQYMSPADARIRLAKIPAQDKFAEQPHGGQYRIEPGDTLSTLAQRFRTSVEALMQLNDLDRPDRIRAGQVLRLPHTAETRTASTQTAPPVPQPRVVSTQTAPPAPRKTEVASRAPDSLAFMHHLTSASMPNSHLAFHLLMAGFPVNELQAQQIEPWLRVHDGSIQVVATETVELYASWLEVSAQRLRTLNRLGRRATLPLGTRLRLDFAKVPETVFTTRRVQYHRDLEDNFFRSRTVGGVITHTLKPGETLWMLARRAYDVPLWLLQKYNHDLEFRALPPGTKLRIPQVVARES